MNWYHQYPYRYLNEKVHFMLEKKVNPG